MKEFHNILICPLFTEKGARLKEKENKLLVKVAREANKIEIKKAIEVMFKVKVDSVATINSRGKKKRLGRYEGRRPSWKKAVITLKKGEKLDFIEGM